MRTRAMTAYAALALLAAPLTATAAKEVITTSNKVIVGTHTLKIIKFSRPNDYKGDTWAGTVISVTSPDIGDFSATGANLVEALTDFSNFARLHGFSFPDFNQIPRACGAITSIVGNDYQLDEFPGVTFRFPSIVLADISHDVGQFVGIQFVKTADPALNSAIATDYGCEVFADEH